MANNDDSLKVLGCFAAFLWIPCLAVLSTLLRGWALITLWRWFIVDSFHVEPLSYIQAVGIALIVHLVTPSSNGDSKKSDDIAKSMAEATIKAISYPLLSVGFAWLVLWFVK